jgi:uncharacterized protein YcnI
MLQAPDEPGGILALPVAQRCATGRASEAWTRLPVPGRSAHDPPRPAPALRLLPPGAAAAPH